MSTLRSWARRVPGLAPAYRALKRLFVPVRAPRMDQVFSDIFRDDAWRVGESASGPGSDLDQTRMLVDALPKLFRELGVRRVLDVPCGDFHWMRHADLAGISYIGGDVVPAMIEANRARYASASPAREFVTLNLCTDALPDADLVLCRDCLVHLRESDVISALQNVARSSCTYLLATTFTARTQNSDIDRTGDWRPLNLCAAPYRLPPPLRLIVEECSEGDNGFLDKSLGLWRVSDVARALGVRYTATSEA